MVRARGVIAAGSALTAEAAEHVLRAGGNAFDAALAALSAACVAEPVLASLGGGGFLLARPADAPPRVYDFFVHTPRSPRPANEAEFLPVLADFGSTHQEFHIGHGSVAVPGVVRGLFEVHRDLATLPMPELVACAVDYARRGVRLTAFQGYLLEVVAAIYTASPAARAVYGSRERRGKLLGEGELLVQPELADALETLAIEGEALFYRGEIAQAIARDLAAGGHLDARDLEGYRVEVREPLATRFRGARLLTNPPPSSGGLLIAFALGLLAHAESDVETAPPAFGGARHVARLARVMELTAEARLAAGGGATPPCPDAARLLAEPFVAAYRERVAGHAASRRGTTQISIIDAAGNVASLSVSNGEGSAYVVPGTGIMLNNMLGEEDLNPGGFHCWPADRRMTSMMAPTVVLCPDGSTVATGSGGSNRIRSAILQVLLNLLERGMDVEEAVQAPRVHYEAGLLSIEGGHDRERLAALRQQYPRQQLWDDRNLFFGGAHTVLAGPGGLRGAGDPRRGGVARVI